MPSPTDPRRKVFAGGRVRALRTGHGLTQRQLAERLSISTSYLNQIENNQRPLTVSLMLALSRSFNVELSDLVDDSSDRVLADLREVIADPVFGDAAPGLVELKTLTTNAPDSARALLRLYEAYRKANERLTSVDAAMADAPTGPQTAYEEVRDFFHYSDNYIDEMDRAAEVMADRIGTGSNGRKGRLIDWLSQTHGVSVVFSAEMRPGLMRRYDRERKTLTIDNHLESASRVFQLAFQLALLEQSGLISDIVSKAAFKTPEARDICRIGLANYYAGAFQMPYGAFLLAAEKLAYDVEELGFAFGASLEQVGHRLSTMQRSGARGVPFFFARVDAAGTITKRHSATPLQFARFGGACPLWNVHRAFEEHGRIIRQLAETPDGHRYLCLAWSSEKRSGGYKGIVRRYAYALGCEIRHADRLVYSTDLDISGTASFEPIGVSCRICTRQTCPQRSVPPIAATISVDPDTREIVPYEIV